MNIALILSGGTGSRMGLDIPKQYIEVNKKPIISYCMETFAQHPMIDAIQIVANEEWYEELKKWLKKTDINDRFRSFSKPGKNRQLSIYNGLKDIEAYASGDDNVIIHDAARPLLSGDMINRCFEAMDGYDGVLPVLPMKDTVYMSKDGASITSLLERKEIFAGQAPECFNLRKYLEANDRLLPTEILSINGSTEPAIKAGMKIAMIDGDEKNFKITTQSDLERFKQIVHERDN